MSVRKALSIRDQLEKAKDGERHKDVPLMSAGHQYAKHIFIMENYYLEAADNIKDRDPKLEAYYRGHASAYRDMYSVFEELVQLDALSEMRAEQMFEKLVMIGRR